MVLALTGNVVLNVEVINNAFIKCGNKGGNLRLKGKKEDDSPLTVTWTGVGGLQFQLQFTGITLETDPVHPPNKEFWPFNEPPPANGLTSLASSHTFTIKDRDFECKYSVIVGSLTLDPVIIVEKK